MAWQQPAPPDPPNTSFRDKFTLLDESRGVNHTLAATVCEAAYNAIHPNPETRIPTPQTYSLKHPTQLLELDSLKCKP